MRRSNVLRGEPAASAWSLDLRVDRWGLGCVLLVAGLSAFARFGHGQAFLGYYEDDFFYYLQIARNLAERGISSFDGIHATNGYHPLWLLVLTFIYKIAPGKSFFYVLGAINVVFVTAAYIFSKQIFLRYTLDRGFATLAAAAIAFFLLTLSHGGMEVTLTLPLIFLFLSYRLRAGFQWGFRDAFWLGFLGSLVVLSRLDAGVLVALVFVTDAVLYRFSLKQWVVRGAWYGLGGWMVGVYLVCNRVWFGTMLPISGHAKQLQRGHHFSVVPLISIFWPLTATKLFLVAPALVFGAVAVFLLLRKVQGLADERSLRSVVVALLLFPPAYFFTISLLSDWPLWPWYLYPFVMVIFAAILLVIDAATDVDRVLSTKMMRYTVIGFVGCVAVYAAVAIVGHGPSELYGESEEIAAFAATHPGTYAMGDRSGTPGYLISSPVIQLEGITMDERFLGYIRGESGLADVFRDYGVRYYVSAKAERINGCYFVTEPRQAGPGSFKMHGSICQEPVARFVGAKNEIDVFDVGRRN